MKLGLLFMDKNDIAISSRSTDFNVQISAVNIHSHCSHKFRQFEFMLFFMIIILKNKYGHSNMCFCDRTNKLPIIDQIIDGAAHWRHAFVSDGHQYIWHPNSHGQ